MPKQGEKDRSAEDQELVRRFLEKWEGVGGTTVEKRVPGVTQSDVSRWRLGHWSYLSTAKRQALRDDLQKSEGRSEFADGVAYALERLAALQKELAGVVAEAYGTAEDGGDVEVEPPQELPTTVMELDGIIQATVASGGTISEAWARADEEAQEMIRDGHLSGADLAAWRVYRLGAIRSSVYEPPEGAEEALRVAAGAA